MAINKNELYNKICEYYDEIGWAGDLYGSGLTMNDWANRLGVQIAPATMTALVRDGFLVVEDCKPVKRYHKPYTEKEAKALHEKSQHQKKINDARNMIKSYEDRKRNAIKNYEKAVANAEQCLQRTLAEYEQWYKEAVVFLEENNAD